ncbi:hypothetical protein SAMN06265222_11794 [Neorhodopirellula lusitana]|uniref:Photolyase/cryptochrome alpha/beta domain-containing protein n=1 Tax=Neorhodopirellula lusitana TaxID=445327 RepID=A0ABY1QLA0_9BACT|nr:hypothetical protein SAMN06265222_11794 [Neorhodopirellula lusitana]
MITSQRLRLTLDRRSIEAFKLLDYQLPARLSQRCDWRKSPDQTDHAPGEFVLYWMHNAVRGHENPALDVAVQLAVQNGLPVLVYHGLAENYPYASDRHHVFILQAARDVQRELNVAGIPYAFHLERTGHRGPHLRDLARRAAALVTETMPVVPLACWTERLTGIVTTPIVTVDTSCVLPMPQANALMEKASSRTHKGTQKQAGLNQGDLNGEDEPRSDDTSRDFQADDQRDDKPKWYTQLDVYKQTTKSAYELAIRQPYSQTNETVVDAAELVPLEVDEAFLGFEPLDLQDANLAELVRYCKIDHSVAPVPDSPGGSRAGYDRWHRYREHGLTEYGSRRCDSADSIGGSRLSAYLHFGMVSPFRIAFEAAQTRDSIPKPNEGVEASSATVGNNASTDQASQSIDKFLNELLYRRELSFHFCQHRLHELDTLDAVPQWAQTSLAEHAGDPRDEATDLESLARGLTDHPLWNAAQRSLLKHGELHNDLRMTWGTWFLPLTACPKQALNYCIDLNHRYALDGRSPTSYGGILGCFGQFDEPNTNEQDIFGWIRPSLIETHSQRLDLECFEKRCDRPIARKLPRVAIIGAGLAGLSAARTLSDHGLEVRVFEKGEEVGGRLATHRNETAMHFDQGAQYFTTRDARFGRHVRSWIDAGVVAPWMATIVELRDGVIVKKRRGQPRYVGTPDMNALPRHLAAGLNITTNCRVTSIVRSHDVLSHDPVTYQLVTDQGPVDGEFDAVLFNCPPKLAHPILATHSPIADAIEQVQMQPCWTLMLTCEGLADLPYAGAFVNQGPLAWVARNDAKPGRGLDESGSQSSWVLHATPDWSSEQIEADPAFVRDSLIDAFVAAIGRPIGKVTHEFAHRWRFASPVTPVGQSCLWDSTAMLGACGDWCGDLRGGPRIEAAYLSGAALAGALLRHVTIDRAPVLIDAVSDQASNSNSSGSRSTAKSS